MTATLEATAAPTIANVTCYAVAVDAALHDHIARLYWDWRALYARATHAVPMQHPDYVLGEARYAPAQRLPSVLVVAERNGECVGIAPLVPKVCQTKRIGSIGLNSRKTGYRLAGNDFLTADNDPAIVAALWQMVSTHVTKSRAAFLLIEDLDEQTALANVIATATPSGWMPFRHTGVQPRRRIHLPETPAEYWNHFSKKTLSTFRRKLKKFGETRLERITAVSDVPRFLEAAHRISLQTWQTRQFGLRVRNNDEERELLTILAQEGLLRSYLWYAQGEPIAFTIGNQDKGCFHYEEVGYMTAQARFSPGQMMLIQMIDDVLTTNRPEWFDFGGGDADYKTLFANHESRSGTLWLWPPTLSNVATVNYIRSCRGLRQGVRRMVVTSGFANRARQWVRYGWNRVTGAKATATVATTDTESGAE